MDMSDQESDKDRKLPAPLPVNRYLLARGLAGED